MKKESGYMFSGTVEKTGQELTGTYEKMYLHDASNPLLMTDKYIRVFKANEKIQPFDGESKFRLYTGEETSVYTVENVDKLIEIQKNEEQDDEQ